MGKVQSETCLICHSDTESVKHLLYSCPVSFQVWIDLKSWITRKTVLNLYLSPQEIILGYLNRDTNFLSINKIIIVTKSYFYCTTITYHVELNANLGRPQASGQRPRKIDV